MCQVWSRWVARNRLLHLWLVERHNQRREVIEFGIGQIEGRHATGRDSVMEDVVNPGEGFALQITVPCQRRTILAAVRLSAVTYRAMRRIKALCLRPILSCGGVLAPEKHRKKEAGC